ncbi:MAG TPA: hypothetical protein VGY54_21900, partial [Polyangiaceae bacterium]|nr:hypothetical protein [Polyangiaceae bacterium]
MMPEQRWESLGKKIEPHWGPERERLALVGIERRATRRRTATVVGASLALLALVAGGVRAYVGLRPQAPG